MSSEPKIEPKNSVNTSDPQAKPPQTGLGPMPALNQFIRESPKKKSSSALPISETERNEKLAIGKEILSQDFIDRVSKNNSAGLPKKSDNEVIRSQNDDLENCIKKKNCEEIQIEVSENLENVRKFETKIKNQKEQPIQNQNSQKINEIKKIDPANKAENQTPKNNLASRQTEESEIPEKKLITSNQRDSLLLKFKKKAENVHPSILTANTKPATTQPKNLEQSELRKWEDPKARIHTFLTKFVKPSPKIYKKKKIGKDKYQIRAEKNNDLESRSYMAKSRRYHHHFNPYQTVDYEEDEEEEKEMLNPKFWSKRGMIRSASSNLQASKASNRNRLNLLAQIEKLNKSKPQNRPSEVNKAKNSKFNESNKDFRHSMGRATLKKPHQKTINVGASMNRHLRFKKQNRMFQSQVVHSTQSFRARSSTHQRPRAVNVGDGFNKSRRFKHLVFSPLRNKTFNKEITPKQLPQQQHKESWSNKGLLADFLKNENEVTSRENAMDDRISLKSNYSARMETLTVELDENRSVCLDDMESKLALFFKKTLVYASKIEILKMKSHKMSGENLTYSIFRRFCNPENGLMSAENFAELVDFLQYPRPRIAIRKIMTFLKHFREKPPQNYFETREFSENAQTPPIPIKNEFKNSNMSEEREEIKNFHAQDTLKYEEFRELFTSHKIMTPEIFLFSNWTPREKLELVIPDPEFYLLRQILMLTSRQLIDTSRIIRTLRAYSPKSIFDYLKMFNSEEINDQNKNHFEPMVDPLSYRVKKKIQTQPLKNKFEMTNHSFGNNLVRSFRLKNDVGVTNYETEEPDRKAQTLQITKSVEVSPFKTENNFSQVEISQKHKRGPLYESSRPERITEPKRIKNRRFMSSSDARDFREGLTQPNSILRSYIKLNRGGELDNYEVESMEFERPDNEGKAVNLESAPPHAQDFLDINEPNKETFNEAERDIVPGPKEIEDYIDVDTVRRFLGFHNIIFLDEDLEVLMNCLGASSGILEFGLFQRFFFSSLWDF